VKYTAVFDFPEGCAPSVSTTDSWLGGQLCAVHFRDALVENERMQEAIEYALARLDEGDALFQELQAAVGGKP